MTEHPVILVLSEGKVGHEEIIKNIRKRSNDEEKETLSFPHSVSLTGYVFHLKTKYYQTELFLVPFEEDISLLPAEILGSIEAVLVYFDSGKRYFRKRIATYAEFMKENEIELGILLCDRLYDDSNEGITYKEAKEESKFLDVIELERTRDEGEEEDPHDPLGYEELLQALRSFIWSNIDIGVVQPPTGTLSKDSQSSSNVSNSDNSVEAELMVFEKLLNEMMTFKNETSTWSRNERLAYAEKFADKFESLLTDCTNSSDED